MTWRPEPIAGEDAPAADPDDREELVEAILLAQARGMDEPAIRELFARDGLTWSEKLKALRAPREATGDGEADEA